MKTMKDGTKKFRCLVCGGHGPHKGDVGHKYQSSENCCPDCGEYGEKRGHMTCQYPVNEQA